MITFLFAICSLCIIIPFLVVSQFDYNKIPTYNKQQITSESNEISALSQIIRGTKEYQKCKTFASYANCAQEQVEIEALELILRKLRESEYQNSCKDNYIQTILNNSKSNNQEIKLEKLTQATDDILRLCVCANDKIDTHYQKFSDFKEQIKDIIGKAYAHEENKNVNI